MTVSTAPTPLSYAGDGSTTAFPITWKYNATTHVVATLRSSAGAETVWVVTTNYTITAAGDSGTLTAVTAPATGQTLLITLEPPNTQGSDIPLGGDFPSVTVEDGLDLSAQRDAKIEALFLRALRVPKTDTQTGSLLEIPIDSLRASMFLAFNASGKPIASVGTSDGLGPVTTFINTLLDDANDATARTTLGAAALAGLSTQSFSANVLTVAGGQIIFPATQNPSADANTLDDYEEGTWTPSLGGTATYLLQTGTYTKIGRLVVFSWRLSVNVIGTGSTTQISGFPFVAGGAATALHASSVMTDGGSATAIVSVNAHITGGLSDLRIRSRTVASTDDAANPIFANSANAYGSGHYYV